MSIDTSTALPAVSLASAKLHLRIDHSDEDALVSALIISATQLAEHELQVGIITRTGTAGFGGIDDVPEVIKQWILVHIGYWYANREAASDSNIQPLPYVGRLLDPFRKWE